MFSIIQSLIFRPMRILMAVVAVFFIFGFVWLSDFFWGPPEAGFVALPFANQECLTYKTFYAKDENNSIKTDVCFENKTDGGFLQKEVALETSYAKDGLTNYSEQDIDKLKQNVSFKSIGYLDQEILRKMKNHSRFYGPADLQVGDIFYDKYPVKNFSKFNNEEVYVIEVRPDIDTAMTNRSIIGKMFWGLMKKNKLIHRSTIRTSSSVDVIERRYYSRKTGILEGLERYTVIRDVDGNIIGEDFSDHKGKYTMILIK